MHSNFLLKTSILASSVIVLSACNLEPIDAIATGQAEVVDGDDLSTPDIGQQTPIQEPAEEPSVSAPGNPIVVNPIEQPSIVVEEPEQPEEIEEPSIVIEEPEQPEEIEEPSVVVEEPEQPEEIEEPSIVIEEPEQPEEPSVVIEEPEQPAVSEGSAFMFQVIDSNDGFVTEIAAGDVIDIATLPDMFNIEAVPMVEQFASVSFEASSSDYSLARVEESPVWTLAASTEGFQAGEGTYTVAATGHSEDRALGTASETAYVTFTLMSSDEPAVVEPPQEVPIVADVIELDISWQKPVLYTNGEALSNAEIAGYEILYRANGTVSYSRVFVEGADNLATELAVEGSGDFEFSIATVGVDGFYSAFSEPELVNL